MPIPTYAAYQHQPDLNLFTKRMAIEYWLSLAITSKRKPTSLGRVHEHKVSWIEKGWRTTRTTRALSASNHHLHSSLSVMASVAAALGGLGGWHLDVRCTAESKWVEKQWVASWIKSPYATWTCVTRNLSVQLTHDKCGQNVNGLVDSDVSQMALSALTQWPHHIPMTSVFWWPVWWSNGQLLQVRT